MRLCTPGFSFSRRNDILPNKIKNQKAKVSAKLHGGSATHHGGKNEERLNLEKTR